MATYKQVRKGSNGSSVSELQKLLNNNGYKLNVDGIFGDQTLQAVQDYQSKNNLDVDGIVGNNTWSSLTKNVSGSDSNGQSTADWLADYDGNQSNQQSQAMKDAANRLTNQGVYQSSYTDQIQSLLDDILNRKEFQYDFSADPLYQQYANRYQQQGKLAMMDTMGQASALTGGYGNTYAQTAGQQAYQNYLQGMNDVIPELYNTAYQAYRNDGNDKLNNLGLLQNMDNTEYNRHLDAQSQANWQAQFDLQKASQEAAGATGSQSKNYNAVFDRFRQLYLTGDTDGADTYLGNAYEQGLISAAEMFEMMALLGIAQRGSSNDDYYMSAVDAGALGSLAGATTPKQSNNTSQSNQSAQSVSVPTTYDGFVKATGKSDIMTESKYNAQKAANALSVRAYPTYKDYLAAMYLRYR